MSGVERLELTPLSLCRQLPISVHPPVRVFSCVSWFRFWFSFRVFRVVRGPRFLGSFEKDRDPHLGVLLTRIRRPVPMTDLDVRVGKGLAHIPDTIIHRLQLVVRM